MPFYGGGRPDPNVKSIQQFAGGNVVIVSYYDDTTEIYADDGNGNAPAIDASECGFIGAALTALS